MNVRVTTGELETLTAAEVVETHDLLAHLIRHAKGQESPALRSMMKKLRRLGISLRCKHCDNRMARREDGICDPCHAYRDHYGLLPPPKTLLKRWSA